MARWTVTDSLELYNVPAWGRGFFDIAKTGTLLVRPDGHGGAAADLSEVVQELEDRGVDLPLLLRFPGIVRARVETLAGAFHTAIAEYGYGGLYRGVFPIKVNQQATLVNEVVRCSRAHHMGLEAGSKPELLICLAYLEDPEALIICNGYKDAEYIETALLARRLGRNTVIVVEKLQEVELVLSVADRMHIEPVLGVRAKLGVEGKGHWKTSSGDRAKFGLSAPDLVLAVRKLQAAGRLDSLRLLHFHIGSQVSTIRTFKQAVKEASRTYVELARLGAPMGFFDVGGGLGVDYDGSQTNFTSSINYTEQEYANDVIFGIQSACDKAGVAHPHVVTECGRATAAYHAVLVFETLGTETRPVGGEPLEVSPEDPDQLREMRAVLDELTARNAIEAWHDALSVREEGLSAYNLGLMDLEQRARLEHLFWQICGRIRTLTRDLKHQPEELEGLPQLLSDTTFCNFSVFQSAPDSWAIGQLFPCVPLQRLNEKPTRSTVLADITCDSDGKLDTFIDLRDVKRALEIHEPDGEPYRLGLFLVGAYQEILGDLHNLFGDTNSVHVVVDADGWHLEHVQEGDTVTDVLGYVGYERKKLVAKVRAACEHALKTGQMRTADAKALIRAYQSGLDGYTYLEKE